MTEITTWRKLWKANSFQSNKPVGGLTLQMFSMYTKLKSWTMIFVQCDPMTVRSFPDVVVFNQPPVSSIHNMWNYCEVEMREFFPWLYSVFTRTKIWRITKRIFQGRGHGNQKVQAKIAQWPFSSIGPNTLHRALRALDKTRSSATREECPWIPKSGRQLYSFKCTERKPWHSHNDEAKKSSFWHSVIEFERIP